MPNAFFNKRKQDFILIIEDKDDSQDGAGIIISIDPEHPLEQFVGTRLPEKKPEFIKEINVATLVNYWKDKQGINYTTYFALTVENGERFCLYITKSKISYKWRPKKTDKKVDLEMLVWEWAQGWKELRKGIN